MSTTTSDRAIGEYVERCDEHLADLPESLRAQLRDDITQIVAEVTAELDGAPDDLVGTPLRFVTELRIAAGLTPPPAAVPPPAPPPRPSWWAQLRDGVRPGLRWSRELVGELRPAWWVARGVIIAIVLARLGGVGERPSWTFLLPVWPVLGSRVLGLAVMGAAIYLSVEAGRRRVDGWRAHLAFVASVVAIVAGLMMVGDVRDSRRPVVYVSNDGGKDPLSVPPTPTGFQAVTIGSDFTGQAEQVVQLSWAREYVDELGAESPPAAIYIQRGGTKTNPGTAKKIDDALVELFQEGYLRR